MHKILILHTDSGNIGKMKTELMEITKWFEGFEAGRGSAPTVGVSSLRFLHDWLNTTCIFEPWEFSDD